MNAAIARMNRVLSDLDELSDWFQNAGFDEEAESLDTAAEAVENSRFSLECLSTFGNRAIRHTRTRPSRRKGQANA